MVKYSLIIPVFNSQKTIVRCLRSIIAQKFKNYEIVIVDDGSIDNTLKLIRKFRNCGCMIKIIKQKHKGVSAARNNGILSCCGEYIIFVDSDDYISKNLLITLNKYDDDVIRYDVNCTNGNDRFKQPYFLKISGEEALTKFCSLNNIFATPWSYAIRRDIYLKNNLFFLEGKQHEDFGLIPLLILEAKIVSSIRYTGYNYIKRKGSITLTETYDKEINRMYDFIDQFNYLRNYIMSKDISSDKIEEYINYFKKRTMIKFNNFQKKISNINCYERIYDKCIEKLKLKDF